MSRAQEYFEKGLSYNEVYEQGRADKYQEIISEYMLLTKEQVAEIRADAIDEYKLGLLEEFDLYEHEHGYPCMADINEILNDTAEQLKEQI